jgi:hypothetical protein
MIGHLRSANHFALRPRPFLAAFDGLRQFRMTISRNKTEDRRSAVIGVNSFLIETKADTMISEHIEDFEKITDLPAWQIGHGADDDLISLSQTAEHRLPTGVLTFTEDCRIVRKAGYHRIATARDGMAKTLRLNFAVVPGSPKLSKGTHHQI